MTISDTPQPPQGTWDDPIVVVPDFGDPFGSALGIFLFVIFWFLIFPCTWPIWIPVWAYRVATHEEPFTRRAIWWLVEHIR